MSTQLHVNDRPWHVISPRVKQATKNVIATIAYIGIDAPDILRLGRGHILVCDASKAAISQGSTSAKALKKYRDRGVKIYSHPGLHAKVVVLSRTAFIGSANVSTHSRDQLNEAVLETTDSEVISQARLFVEGMATEYARLSKLDIDKLCQITVVRRPMGPKEPKILLRVPKEVPRLWLMAMAHEFATPSVERVIAREGETIKSQVREDGVTAGVKPLLFDSDLIKGVAIGDWLLAVLNNDRVEQPVRILKISVVSKNWRIVWVAVPKFGKKSMNEDRYRELLNFDWEKEDERLVEGPATKPILKPFLD